MEVLFPQLPITILLTPTKGSWAIHTSLHSHLREKDTIPSQPSIICSKCWQNILNDSCIGSLRWPLYWLFWVTGLIRVFACMDWTQAFSLWSWSCSPSHLGSSICQRSLLTRHLTGSELLVFYLVNPEENPSVRVLATPGLMSPEGWGLLESVHV